MYSLLLMTALSSGGSMQGADAAAPVAAPIVVAGCTGCNGCLGTTFAYGCYGAGSCNGCWGGSCNGCWGNSCNGCCGGRPGLFARWHARKASCYGCNGCTGCSGCFGGGCHGTKYYHQGCYGVMPAYGCSGCYGMPVAPAVIIPAVEAPMAEPAPATTTEQKTTANITIELPAQARLIVDGQPTESTGSVRQFHTPALPAGQAFFYEMKAELVINGETVVEDLKVIVHAGEHVVKSFETLMAAEKATPRTIAAK